MPRQMAQKAGQKRMAKTSGRPQRHTLFQDVGPAARAGRLLLRVAGVLLACLTALSTWAAFTWARG